MTAATETRRQVMLLAWSLYRAELRGANPRTFADALAGAWRWVKNTAARIAAAPRWAKGAQPRHVSFGSMLASPIRRSLTGQAYAGVRARQAGYTTAQMGR